MHIYTPYCYFSLTHINRLVCIKSNETKNRLYGFCRNYFNIHGSYFLIPCNGTINILLLQYESEEMITFCIGYTKFNCFCIASV